MKGHLIIPVIFSILILGILGFFTSQLAYAAPGDFIGSFIGTTDGGTRFSTIISITVDSNDRIIVLDAGLQTVQIFDSTGSFLSSFDGTTGGGTKFSRSLRGIAVDSNDRIIVVDTGSSPPVQIFDSTGSFVGSFGGTPGGSFDDTPGGTKFRRPNGVAVDSNDRIIVTDRILGIVQIFDSTGSFLSSFDGTTGGGTEFSSGSISVGPTAVTVDSNDRIIVTDTSHDIVQIFDDKGSFVKGFDVKIAGTPFALPFSITVDSNDRIYVADFQLRIVQIFDSRGSFLSKISGFLSPVGVAVDSNDRIIVADFGRRQVRIYEGITGGPVGCPEPELEGIPGLVASRKDVQFTTVSDGTLDQDFGRGEEINFRIYTYVDSNAVSNVRLLIASEGSGFFENADVFINNNYLGTLANAFDDTTFEIGDKSFVNWKTEDNLVGENLIKVSLPDCNAADSVGNIDFGGIFAEQRHIIFVPGIGGTELRNLADTDGFNGIEWIDIIQYAFDDDIEDLALNEEGTGPGEEEWDIFAGDIIRSVAGGIVGVYQPYFDFLKSKGYYSEITFDEYKDESHCTFVVDIVRCTKISDLQLVTPYPPSNLRLHEFPYDWRLDNAVHANRLGVLIDDLTMHPDGWDKVFLTAHSMGGLITKKHISQTNGDDVEVLFTMGTPYYGAVKPYKFFKLGDDFDIPTLEDETMKELVKNWPSTYQLLVTQKYFDSPLTLNPYGFSDFDAGGGIITIGDPSLRKVYLDDITSKVPNSELMEQAIEFHEDMGDGFFNVENVYIATGIDVDTIVNVRITGSRDSPEYVFVFNGFGGDGTVPTTSGEAMLEGTENIERRSFSGATHGDIPNEEGVQDWLWKIITVLNASDSDDDGISDELDTKPDTSSVDFNYEAGNVSGKIIDTGGLQVTITVSPADESKIRIKVDGDAGLGPAKVEVQGTLFELNRGSSVDFSSGSVTVTIISGTTTLNFTVGGVPGVIILNAGDVLTFDPDTLLITAGGTDVVVIIGSQTITIPTGTTVNANFALRSGGGGGDETPPSFNTVSIFGAKSEQDDGTFGFGGIFQKEIKLVNSMPTAIVETGQEIQLRIEIYENSGLDALQHVSLYMNLRGHERQVHQSDTFILYDKGSPIVIKDSNGYLSNADVELLERENSIEAIFSMTFEEEMDLSDIIIRTWDFNRNSRDAIFGDAIQVIPAEQQPEEDDILDTPQNNEPTMDTEPGVDLEVEMDPEQLMSMQVLDDWAGYSNNPISDSEFLSHIGIDGEKIPSWFKNKNAKWVRDGMLTKSEFVNALQFFDKQGFL